MPGPLSEATYRLSQSQLRTYLARIGARFAADRSSPGNAIYYAAPISKWLLVQKAGYVYDVSLFSTCPCGG